jgi:thiosulfate/3-mercaptopyruvate sulfurtransferase
MPIVSFARCLSAACIVLVMQSAVAATPLVAVEWLEENLGRDDVVLIDASPGPLYRAGHVPGAVNHDIFSFGAGDAPPAGMEKRIQALGISPGKKIVLYDQGGTYFATSLFLDLYYYGIAESDMVVLDGGLAKWKSVGGPVTKEPTPPREPGTFKVTKVREEMRVRLPEFLVASGDPSDNALVEGLDPEQHFGAMKFFDRAGHIPNAVMTPASDYFNADKTFKAPGEIGRMLDYLGVKREQQVLAHCGGGIAASVPFFAAKFLLDYPKVRLYKESQLEWMRDDRGLPLWTYDQPNVIRDRAWLNGWGNAMMRRYGVANLAVIDVRPAATFAQAHLPFAINIPVGVFRSHVADPEKLAAALAAAGVNPAHEAVIVSQGGITPDAALAYAMLEKIGHKRVSIFTESVDDWGFAGFPLEKEVRPAKPAIYEAKLRPAILVKDTRRSDAPYPRVYLASGATLPAAAPEGKVIHVPYTQLLDEKGAPRPAKDIWAALVKAGLPRYAEIVTVSDDPGEAAANYFLLRLMGYPDVKLLVIPA